METTSPLVLAGDLIVCVASLMQAYVASLMQVYAASYLDSKYGRAAEGFVPDTSWE